MDHQFLSNTALFEGLNENEINSVLSCLEAREVSYSKGGSIIRSGSETEVLGLVMRGSVNIYFKLFQGGNRVIETVFAGGVFGEAFSSLSDREMIWNVDAAEDCTVLLISADRLLTVCENVCSFHQKLIRNLFTITSRKNSELTAKLMHTESKSTRDRLMSYFSEQSHKSGSVYFTVPYSRQQLADYLGVERSALSNTLSKMQKDGIIQYHKNNFKFFKSRF